MLRFKIFTIFPGKRTWGIFLFFLYTGGLLAWRHTPSRGPNVQPRPRHPIYLLKKKKKNNVNNFNFRYMIAYICGKPLIRFFFRVTWRNSKICRANYEQTFKELKEILLYKNVLIWLVRNILYKKTFRLNTKIIINFEIFIKIWWFWRINIESQNSTPTRLGVCLKVSFTYFERKIMFFINCEQGLYIYIYLVYIYNVIYIYMFYIYTVYIPCRKIRIN